MSLKTLSNDGVTPASAAETAAKKNWSNARDGWAAGKSMGAMGSTGNGEPKMDEGSM